VRKVVLLSMGDMLGFWKGQLREFCGSASEEDGPRVPPATGR
jgi:hypothetical protein